MNHPKGASIPVVVENTPVESYMVGDRRVFVKREDKATLSGGPPFSKVRGLLPHMTKLKESGVTTVGYVETSVSMAGWGVAWCGSKLGMDVVIFDPQYTRNTLPILLRHRVKWEELGARLVPIPAGRAKIAWYSARRDMPSLCEGKSLLLPLGIPFPETVEEVAAEWQRTMHIHKPAVAVVNVGSGTICAGLLRGWAPGHGRIIGVMGRTGNIPLKMASIQCKAGVLVGGLLGPPLELVDPGWQYTEESKCDCPFPCHRYYDLKAWQWLVENLGALPSPILFWNIGREVE